MGERIQTTKVQEVFSFIQTVTVGPGVKPGLLAQVRDLPLADYTAGGDLHPAHEKGATLLSVQVGRQCALQSQQAS